MRTANTGAGGSLPRPAIVLIVDDAEDHRVMYRDFLLHKGYVVLEAGDGLEALARVEEHQPDLIVTDLAMPKMCGEKLIRALRERYPSAKFKIFALSAFPSEIAGVMTIHSGPDALLSKPCTPYELEREISRQLGTEDLDLEALARLG